MRELIRTSRFRRELRRAARRGKDVRKIQDITDRLVASEPLDPQNNPNQLVGNWRPFWECHIEPDWLLVWDEDENTVTLMHTGTHSDIFG
jgi:mRNA interferase YafQ